MRSNERPSDRPWMFAYAAVCAGLVWLGVQWAILEGAERWLEDGTGEPVPPVVVSISAVGGGMAAIGLLVVFLSILGRDLELEEGD